MLIRRHSSSSRFVTASAASSSSREVTAGYQNSVYNPVYDNLEEGSVIEEWIPKDPIGIHRLMRLIHLRDPVVGPAVDMFADLPWSDYLLTGCPDQKMRDVFEASLDNLRLTDLMPDVALEYLVVGKCCLSLLFNDSAGVWFDAFPFDPDCLRVTPRPIRNAEPRVDFKPTEGMKEFVESRDERDQEFIDMIPDEFLQNIRKGDYIPLQADNTPYIARKGSASDKIGTSVLSRIIPAWALEKQLLSGTAVAMKRRLGGIVFVQAGSEDWEPSDEEMSDIASMFVTADIDPVSAVVVTKRGVDAQRLESNQNIWTIGSEFQFLTEWKMRGLGLSEALMGGEARIETAETARSAFTERLLAMRSYLTKNFIQKRILLPLSKAHEFRKRTTAQLDHRIRIASEDESDYVIPGVQWEKTLEPVSDMQWVELLRLAEEKKIPIPVKMWADAIGINLKRIDEMFEGGEDKRLRDKLAEHAKNSGIELGSPEDAMLGASLRTAGAPSHRNTRIGRKPTYSSIKDLPIWGKDGCFMGVHWMQAMRDMSRVQAAVGESGLANGELVARKARKMLSRKRAEIALLSMDRLGIVQQNSINPAIGANVMSAVQSSGDLKAIAEESDRVIGQTDTRRFRRQLDRALEVTDQFPIENAVLTLGDRKTPSRQTHLLSGYTR